MAAANEGLGIREILGDPLMQAGRSRAGRCLGPTWKGWRLGV